MDKPKVVVLVGPTAGGKTGLALNLARSLGAEIISADAVAVYKGLNIGSAKPAPEEQRLVRHHLIDVVHPHQEFTAAKFVELARQAVTEITKRGGRVLVAGGTGLYVKAMLGGLFKAPAVNSELRQKLQAQARTDPRGLHLRLAQADPQAAARLNPRDSVRVIRALEIFLQTGRTMTQLQQEHGFRERPYQTLILGLKVSRKPLAERIEARTKAMFEQGLVEEVAGLLAQGIDPQAKPMQSIGYKQVVALIQGQISQEEAVRQTVSQTKKLAKRQMTWFRANPDVLWLPEAKKEAFVEAARRFWEETKR